MKFALGILQLGLGFLVAKLAFEMGSSRMLSFCLESTNIDALDLSSILSGVAPPPSFSSIVAQATLNPREIILLTRDRYDLTLVCDLMANLEFTWNHADFKPN